MTGPGLQSALVRRLEERYSKRVAASLAAGTGAEVAHREAFEAALREWATALRRCKAAGIFSTVGWLQGEIAPEVLARLKSKRVAERGAT